MTMEQRPWHTAANTNGMLGRHNTSHNSSKGASTQALNGVVSFAAKLPNGHAVMKGDPFESPLQLQWPEARVSPGCGLVNVGNSCFLNSTLQCLAHLPPLAALSQAHAHKSRCSWDIAAADGKCVACLLEMRLRRCLSAATPSPDCPNGLVNNMSSRISRSLSPGRQEDAHEFLRMLLDAAERDALRSLRGDKPLKGRLEPQTLVQHLFGGVLTSDVICGSCGEVSSTRDQLLDLSLELQHCSTLLEALRRFTAAEQLLGANAYKCGSCNRKVTATKQMRILEAPNILVLHFKRFSGRVGAKITRHIAFQETLSLRPFCSSASPELKGSSEVQVPSTAQSPGQLGSSTSISTTARSQQPSPPKPRPFIGPQAPPPGHAANEGSQASASGDYVAATAAAAHPGDTDARSPEYRLYGVLVHQGQSAQSGHYYAFVQAPEGQWNRMNDATCYRVSVAKVLAEAAYMLFYVRSTPRHYEPLSSQARAAEKARLQKKRPHSALSPATDTGSSHIQSKEHPPASAPGALDIHINANGTSGASPAMESSSAESCGKMIPDPAPFGPMPPPMANGFRQTGNLPARHTADAAVPEQQQQQQQDSNAAKRQCVTPAEGQQAEGSQPTAAAGIASSGAQQRIEPVQRQQQTKQQQRQWKKHGIQLKGGFVLEKPPQQNGATGRGAASADQGSPVDSLSDKPSNLSPSTVPDTARHSSVSHASRGVIGPIAAGPTSDAQCSPWRSGATATSDLQSAGPPFSPHADSADVQQQAAAGAAQQHGLQSQDLQLQHQQRASSTERSRDQAGPHTPEASDNLSVPPPPPSAAPTLEDRATAMFPMEPDLADAYQKADLLIRNSAWPAHVRTRIEHHLRARGKAHVSGKAAMLADLRAQMGSDLAKELSAVVRSAVSAMHAATQT